MRETQDRQDVRSPLRFTSDVLRCTHLPYYKSSQVANHLTGDVYQVLFAQPCGQETLNPAQVERDQKPYQTTPGDDIVTDTQENRPKQAGLRGLPRNVWAVSFTSFFNDISSEMVINIVPLFLANVLGVETGVIGLVEGVAASTASSLKAFSGWLSDKLQGRKWLAVSGYALSTLSKPFFYVANSWLAVGAVRWPDLRGTAYGTYNAVVGVLDFPASLIAGVLWQGVGLWEGLGPSAPFLFGGALALAAAVLMALVMPMEDRGGEKGDG